MESILNELYHGMLHPEEEYHPSQACRATRKMLAARQAVLLEKMRETDPDMCCEVEEILEEENAADAMEMEEAYVQGMRLGARLALGLLGEKA